MASNSVREKFARFQTLASNIRANLAELPDVTANHTAFEEIVNRIRDSLAEQDAMAARLSHLISLRTEDMKQAIELRHRLAGQLQGHFGTASERLREFGVKPRRRRKRKSETPGEDPAPAPTPAPEAPAGS